MKPVWRAIRAHPGPWLLWSGIGFVLFYVLLSYAAASGPSWLVAGTFQLTVIAGMVCAPFLYRDTRARIPLPALLAGVVVICGVLLMQVGYGGGKLDREAWIALVAVAISAFAYPLGNRGLLLHLERAGIELNATQRVFGMTLASQPLWWAIAAGAFATTGAPPASQVFLAAGVALGAGVIATVLFFQATGMVRNDPTALAAAEAMQAAEILFATLIGVLWLGEAWPQGRALWGAAIVIAGIVVFSIVASRAAFAVGVLILAGVLLLQLGTAHGTLDRAGWIALACVLGSAVLYPLGNRLLLLHLERTGENLNATQRVFGMTLASQPLWWLVAAFAWQQTGTPSASQVWLAGGVALSAGVIATILFFQATGMVRDNPVALGAAEAMQAAELLFATLLGVSFLHEPWPQGVAVWGAVLVVAGIAAFAWIVVRQHATGVPQARALRTDRGA
jgi:drug/metabolite transporter (DMT)-like permease